MNDKRILTAGTIRRQPDGGRSLRQIADVGGLVLVIDVSRVLGDHPIPLCRVAALLTEEGDRYARRAVES